MNAKTKLPSLVEHGGAITAVALAAGLVLAADDARACGACYASQSESTIVNDHRMALSISPQMTVLWDQIAYSGSPSQFAYVIPAKPGTRLEVSNDGWFAALDASTRPIVMSPKVQGYGGGGGYAGGGGHGYTTDSSGGGGCCTSEDLSAMNAESGPSFADAGASAGSPTTQADPVQIISQDVVGPYETVTLRSQDPDALFAWLEANHFAIPDDSRPIIEDYVKAGLDFIAMHMRPSAEARAMQPIRILSPGPDPTLPLRMMRIGSGANLGITLFVIGESRYRAKNFPNVSIDPSAIVWDYAKQKSNYVLLSKAAMTAGDGRGWLTEYANRPSLTPTGSVGTPGMIGNPALVDAYQSVCPSSIPYEPPDASTEWADSGSEAGADAGAADGGADDGGLDDAGADGGDAGAVGTLPPRTRTRQCDDLELAVSALHESDVWLTRMRAFLPNAAMEQPLELEPVAGDATVDNVYVASTSGTVAARIAPSKATRGTWALILAAGLVLSRVLLRRRQQR